MAILKCKMCGGDLNVEDGITVCECEYCGTKQTVPTIDDEKKVKLFARANKLRSNCEFDKAAGVYENIVADYSEEAEGYWGLILCRYGIEYVDDPETGKKIPTCHRSSFDSIMDDEDFELVMENSDAVSRAVYREEAKYIEEIRKGIIEVSGKEEPYDIFICYKETDENGDRTLDSVLAQDVYDELTKKGYRVFFSRITLEDKLGVEYEPYIFAALNSAKIMLAFGTSYDYYNAVWVKNEWSRYLKLMAKDKSKHLIPCFKNVDAYDIPKEFSKLQAQDMGKIGAVQDLIRGIDKLISPELKVEKVSAPENVIYNSIGANVEVILKRGFMFIEDGEWSKATEFFEQVLNINAEEGQAYWGELLAEHKCKDAESLGRKLHSELVKKIASEQLVVEVEDRYPDFKNRFFFMDIFSQDDIEKLFYTPFNYESSVSSLQNIITDNQNNFVLEGSRLFQRANQYADNSVRININTLVETVESCLAETLADIKSKEQEAKKIAVEKSNAYFAKLERALQKSNDLARDNNETNEAAYQADHKLWEKERDEFPAIHADWERLEEQRRREYDEWQEQYGSILENWNIEKVKYTDDKKRLEKELAYLEDEKSSIDGFMADKKIAKKEIMDVRVQLSHLSFPKEPVVPEAPIIPEEPTLRAEPVRNSFGKMIGEDSVLEVFRECMA